jgi:hypothetical protein
MRRSAGSKDAPANYKEDDDHEIQYQSKFHESDVVRDRAAGHLLVRQLGQCPIGV